MVSVGAVCKPPWALRAAGSLRRQIPADAAEALKNEITQLKEAQERTSAHTIAALRTAEQDPRDPAPSVYCEDLAKKVHNLNSDTLKVALTRHRGRTPLGRRISRSEA